MHSETRRPDTINVDQFFETLDRRLRTEVRETRRVTVPNAWNRFIRALKIRALALFQGGALMLTAFAVIVAVGVAPAVINAAGSQESDGVIAAPTVRTQSLVVSKKAVLIAAGVPAVEVQSAPNLIE